MYIVKKYHDVNYKTNKYGLFELNLCDIVFINSYDDNTYQQMLDILANSAYHVVNVKNVSELSNCNIFHGVLKMTYFINYVNNVLTISTSRNVSVSLISLEDLLESVKNGITENLTASFEQVYQYHSDLKIATFSGIEYCEENGFNIVVNHEAHNIQDYDSGCLVWGLDDDLTPYSVHGFINDRNVRIAELKKEIRKLEHEIKYFEYSISDEEYEEYLNAGHETIKVLGFEYEAGYALRLLDNIAFRTSKSDFESCYDLDDVEEYQEMIARLENLKDELDALL